MYIRGICTSYSTFFTTNFSSKLLKGGFILICPSFNRAINYMVGTHPVGITSGDFNGDGNLDLAVANNSFVSILLGV